ncbi:hypothetical protein Tco_0019588 [Tanacetum coccineum]
MEATGNQAKKFDKKGDFKNHQRSERRRDRYVVPTGRVVVPAGRYIVPAGKVILIVSTGRLSLVPTGRVLSPGSDNDSDDASVHSEATIPQQQRNNQPQYITTVSNNNAKFPYLKKDEYEVWAMKMEYWITNNDMNIWKVIQNGNSLKRTRRDCDGRVIILPPTTADEHIAVQRESKARTTLLQSIPDDHVADFHYMDDARDIWNAVKARFGGNAKSKKMRKFMLKQEFSEFRIGLVPNLVPAAPYVPPTNKELEILFQPMFDEYLEPLRIERPASPAPAVSVPVNSAGTPSSITIDQDAPSPSHSLSSLALHSPSLHQGVAADFTLMEDNPFASADNHPFINVFAPKPSSEASSSGDLRSAESPYVSQTLHHLGK